MDMPFDKHDLTVGFFTLICLLALAVLTVLLAGGDLFALKSVEVHTFLSSTFGLKKGVPVTFLDMQVGKVKSVEFSNLSGPERQVRVVFSVYEKFQDRIYTDFTTSLEQAQFGAFLSGKIMLDAPDPVVDGPLDPSRRPVGDGDELRYKKKASMFDGLTDLPKQFKEEVLPQVKESLEKVDKLLSEVLRFMEDLNDPEGDAKKTLATMRMTAETLLDPEGELMRSLKLANRFAEEIVAEENLVMQVLKNRALLDDATETLSNVKRITGEGAELAEQAGPLMGTANRTAAQVEQVMKDNLPRIETILDGVVTIQKQVQDLLRTAELISGTVVEASSNLPTLMGNVESQMAQLEDITRAVKNIFLIRWYLDERQVDDPTLLKPLLLGPGDAAGEGPKGPNGADSSDKE